MTTEFKIGDRKIGGEAPPFIIAELSGNHNGSIERAKEIIFAAKKCGADAIKLQTYTADTITIDCDEEDFIVKGGLWDGYKLYDLYKLAQTPFEWHKELFDYAKSLNILIFSTPFDESAVDLLEKLKTPAYKIASFELIDLPLIRYVAKTGKPMIMSTGMANEREIEEAVEVARSAGCNDIALLHCISSYPAPIDQSNLRQLPVLSKRFNAVPGLSDHTHGTAVSIAAVALGAAIIEKHFTLSRKDGGPDSEFSLEPAELQRLCEDAKNSWLALGMPGFERQKSEVLSNIFRRSIYFVRDVSAGSIITRDDIRSIRPGSGLPPKHLDELIGKKLRHSVKKGFATNWEVFE
jgi:N-acetylneuraminate synthase